jgi:hypothetical protein
MVMRTHPITIGHRKRTEKLPMDAKIRLVTRSPGRAATALQTGSGTSTFPSSLHHVPSWPG